MMMHWKSTPFSQTIACGPSRLTCILGESRGLRVGGEKDEEAVVIAQSATSGEYTYTHMYVLLGLNASQKCK